MLSDSVELTLVRMEIAVSDDVGVCSHMTCQSVHVDDTELFYAYTSHADPLNVKELFLEQQSQCGIFKKHPCDVA